MSKIDDLMLMTPVSRHLHMQKSQTNLNAWLNDERYIKCAYEFNDEITILWWEKKSLKPVENEHGKPFEYSSSNEEFNVWSRNFIIRDIPF